MDYVSNLAARYGHRLIVAGVPASNIPLDALTEEAGIQLAGLIRTFNEHLKARALAAGMDFLDLHALTDRGSGWTEGQWHIDEIHLLPSALAEAFDKHLAGIQV